MHQLSAFSVDYPCGLYVLPMKAGKPKALSIMPWASIIFISRNQPASAIGRQKLYARIIFSLRRFPASLYPVSYCLSNVYVCPATVSMSYS